MCCDDGWHWVSVSVRGDKKSNYECRGGTREWWGSKDSEKRQSPPALRHLPPLLHRLREAVEDTHTPCTQSYKRTHNQVIYAFTAAIMIIKHTDR